MPIQDCTVIELPKIIDARGNLTFVEGKRHIPFVIKRVYFLYDIPAGAARAAHAHKNLHQLMIAISGSFDLILNDGISTKKYVLNQPNFGVYIPPMTWRDLANFSSGAACLVLASDYFDESDYYRDYDEFVNAVRLGGK